jgi:glycosyltransferase involved in cell wall biosynthesis
MSSAYYGAAAGSAPLVLSTHNADSSLLLSVARSSSPLDRARWTHRSIATRRLERRVAPAADAVLCVSDADCAHFRRFGARTILAPNGVDDDLFDVPAEPPPRETVLFFGQFDYGPNADGIERFLTQGWPDLVARRPDARLRLVGGGLGGPLAALANDVPGVEVAGLVPSMAEELAAARLVVVPLWQGGGTRLKVLEALAAARPVVGTALGVEGIGFEAGVHGRLADTPPALAREAEGVLAAPMDGRAFGLAGRALVQRFRWRTALAETERLYRGYLERWAAAAPAARSAAG